MLVVEELHQLGADGVVGAGEDREADHVDVFLHAAEAIISGVWRKPV